MFSAAQLCKIDIEHADFPEGFELLEEGELSDNKCSAIPFNLSSVGNVTEMECEIKCKVGYYNVKEEVKIYCDPNSEQTSPDGITRYDICDSTWMM